MKITKSMDEHGFCEHCGHSATCKYLRINGASVLICNAQQCLRDEWSIDDEIIQAWGL